ncbi:hypothetical protein [Crossiella sp. CA198]|uniref:hypothetical protein n=1 Tax=Crossiella sp. CA198 TaxID=3455607 RepID=UPI003F8D8E49
MAIAGGILAASPASPASPVSAAPAPAAPATTAGALNWVCAGSPIPAGQVITIVGKGCNGLGSWFVVPVQSSGMWICDISPIPPGYVITNALPASNCGAFAKSYFIRLPRP